MLNNAFCLLLLLGIIPLVQASDSPDLEFNGFITQGFILTDHNHFYGNSDAGSFDFREVGVNSSWRVNDRMLLTGQLMSRLAGDVDDGTPMVDYALVDYRLFEGQEGQFGIQFGRIKNPFGFYNRTRDVAFTRPSIVLPQSLYFDKARDFELSSDGMSLYGSYLTESGVLETELLLGNPRSDTNVEYAYLNRDWPGGIDRVSGYLLRTEYRLHDYSFIGALSLGDFEMDLDLLDTPAPGMTADGQIDVGIFALSAQYNWQQWSLTAEFFRQEIRWSDFGGFFSPPKQNISESFYLQLEQRLSPQLSWFVRRDILYMDTNDRNGMKTQALTGRPAHTQFAKDWTIGLGWQPTTNWLLRAEIHQVDGTAWLPIQENSDEHARSGDWRMLALQATYRF